MTNKSNDNINAKDFLIGSLVGTLVGASLALLFAPKSGKELRGDINKGAHELKDKAVELKDVASEKTDEFKKYAKEQSAHLQDIVSEKKQEFEEK